MTCSDKSNKLNQDNFTGSNGKIENVVTQKCNEIQMCSHIHKSEVRLYEADAYCNYDHVHRNRITNYYIATHTCKKIQFKRTSTNNPSTFLSYSLNSLTLATNSSPDFISSIPSPGTINQNIL